MIDKIKTAADALMHFGITTPDTGIILEPD